MKPFTKKNGGVYRCIASNLLLSQQASRRIKLSVGKIPKKVKDLSNLIKTSLISNTQELKLGSNVKLKCSIDYFDSEVYWTRKGYMLSDKVITSSNKNSAFILIKNFQKEDFGVYLCKAKATDPNILEYKIKGQASFYLMPSDFGISSQNVKLLGPEVTLKCNSKDSSVCGNNLNIGDKFEIICEINEFGNEFFN